MKSFIDYHSSDIVLDFEGNCKIFSGVGNQISKHFRMNVSAEKSAGQKEYLW